MDNVEFIFNSAPPADKSTTPVITLDGNSISVHFLWCELNLQGQNKVVYPK